MRHLIEVMLVVEGKEEWARRLAEKRREQGLPLPSLELVGSGSTRVTRSYWSLAALVRRVVENKEVGRVVISFL